MGFKWAREMVVAVVGDEDIRVLYLGMDIFKEVFHVIASHENHIVALHLGGFDRSAQFIICMIGVSAECVSRNIMRIALPLRRVGNGKSKQWNQE
jgi:hypothetical protein